MEYRKTQQEKEEIIRDEFNMGIGDQITASSMNTIIGKIEAEATARSVSAKDIRLPNTKQLITHIFLECTLRM